MRKLALVVMLLLLPLAPRVASADPLRITGGTFALDIEGDTFVLNGPGFWLQTTELLIYSSKIFQSQCFQCPAGELVDWSFRTDGDQLLGIGTARIGAVDASNVEFWGTMNFRTVPTPLAVGSDVGALFVAPFAFTGSIRGLSGGELLFAENFTGRGRVSVSYEAGAAPGLFTPSDDNIPYEFSPVPEPATLVLLGSGLGALIARRKGMSW